MCMCLQMEAKRLEALKQKHGAKEAARILRAEKEAEEAKKASRPDPRARFAGTYINLSAYTCV